MVYSMSLNRFITTIYIAFVVLTTVVLLITDTSSQSGVATASVIIGNKVPNVTEVVVYDPDIEPTDGNYNPGAGTNYSINCSAIVSDENGWNDITKVNATLYHSEKSSSDGVDDFDVHYTDESCNLYAGEDTQRNANCSFTIVFWADDGDTIGVDEWVCNLTAWDAKGKDGSNNNTLLINAVYGINVTSSINFGIMELGEITPTDEKATIGNLGNDGIDIQVNSSDMVCDITGAIPVDNIHYNSSSGSEYSSMCALGEDKDETCSILNETFDLNDCENQCTAGYSNRNTFWKIYIPDSNLDGSCESMIIFTAKDSDPVI